MRDGSSAEWKERQGGKNQIIKSFRSETGGVAGAELVADGPRR